MDKPVSSPSCAILCLFVNCSRIGSRIPEFLLQVCKHAPEGKKKTIVEEDPCEICKHAPETPDHLFFLAGLSFAGCGTGWASLFTMQQ